MPRLTLAFAATVLASWPTSVAAQATARTDEPEVEVIHTVGGVEQRQGQAAWWMARAAEPTVTKVGPFNEDEVEEARDVALGDREFQLIGVAEFLDSHAQLDWGDRASFTTSDQTNATRDLRDGRRVFVKGLLIDADSAARINLLSVVALADSCS